MLALQAVGGNLGNMVKKKNQQNVDHNARAYTNTYIPDPKHVRFRFLFVSSLYPIVFRY